MAEVSKRLTEKPLAGIWLVEKMQAEANGKLTQRELKRQSREAR